MDNKFFRLYLKILIPIVFCLIALGGATRAMHAGLACPDWPLCFGKIIPDYQLQVYYEFTHRALAGIVGILTLILTILIFYKKLDVRFKKTILIVDGILFAQIILGGMTVLHLLRFEVVTLHLIFGLLFLCSLTWLLFQFSDSMNPQVSSTPKMFNIVLAIVLVVLFVQIAIGGLVSSNYAGLACGNTFPLCFEEFFPKSDSYLVQLQVLHRKWGYLTALAIFSMFQVMWKNRKSEWMSAHYLKLGGALVLFILIQIGVGAVNVIYKTPPIITVVHTFFAALILVTILRIFYLGLALGKK